ncbi:Uncharacterised protein [Lederbergia lenta]|uniref:Uncharacterized protein n=1 Tax=Lederbergia lenta TaxID=1467 RepID=A0A2X4WFL0_LEDLE|nr:Uncharacterised protein [Lederbergia lenta]
MKDPDLLRRAGWFPLGTSKNFTALMYGTSFTHAFLGEPIVVKGLRSFFNLIDEPINTP